MIYIYCPQADLKISNSDTFRRGISVSVSLSQIRNE